MAVLIDGYQTTMTFGSTNTIYLRERTVTPPEFDGGGPINTTSMYNAYMRTQAPKALRATSPMTMSAFWDVRIYSQLLTMQGVNQEIFITFPDWQQLGFWGWIDKFTPPEMTEGEEPIAEITIIASHAMGERGSGAEVAPFRIAAPVPAPLASTRLRRI